MTNIKQSRRLRTDRVPSWIGVAGNTCGWLEAHALSAFVGMTLLLLLFSHPAFADDDLSSTIRTSPPPAGISSTIRTAQPIDLSSTVRAKPLPASSIDPMLDTSAPNPKDTLNTDNMTSSDPALSTTQNSPLGTSSLAQPETSKKNAKPAIDPKFCNALTKATPRADVAYQPGVDASGNKVAPADLPGGNQVQLPSKIEIPLTFQLTKLLNLDTTKPPFNQLGTGTEAYMGSITVEGDKVSLNGQPLSDTQQDNLAVLCMKQK